MPNRRSLLIGVASLLLMSAQAHASGPRACDGKHRRPANLYGSVLSQGLTPASRPPEGATSPAWTPTPPSAAREPARSSRDPHADLRASFASCAGDHG